jgi:hypothetical protein
MRNSGHHHAVDHEEVVQADEALGAAAAAEQFDRNQDACAKAVQVGSALN